MVKLLLCGHVNGQWATVFERAQKLNTAAAKSGAAPFELLVCVGGAFPLPLEYIDGSKRVPLPTYFIAAHEDATAAWKQDTQQLALYDKLRGASSSSTVKASDDTTGTTAATTPAPMQIAENLFFLGHHGITTLHGLNIAFLSGTAAAATTTATDASPTDAFTYTRASIDALIDAVTTSNKRDALDFLLTAEYAAGFERLLPDQHVPLELAHERGASLLTPLLTTVSPRYHITSGAGSTSSVFYQRLPYVSESRSSGQKHVTRLIGLSRVSATKDKRFKYLHALQVVGSLPGASVDIPAGTTQSPYVWISQPPCDDVPRAKRQRLDNASVATAGLSTAQIAQLTAASATNAQFFYDPKLAARGLRHTSAAVHRPHNAPVKPLVPNRIECWFCLATPSVERHLIVSIGSFAYVAIPKGAINADHVLIVPIAHAATTTALPNDAIVEIERFKTALAAFFASHQKGMMVIDRNVETIGATHCHIQCIGVPLPLVAAARSVFDTESAKYRVDCRELRKDETLHAVVGDKSFFYAEVPVVDDDADEHATIEAVKAVRLLHLVDSQKHHAMQFGRHVAACVVNVPRRSNWKHCVVSKDEETAMATAFRKLWQPFDFTLVDEEDEEE